MAHFNALETTVLFSLLKEILNYVGRFIFQKALAIAAKGKVDTVQSFLRQMQNCLALENTV